MKFLVAIGLLAGLSAVVANIEDFGAAEGTVTPNEEIDEEDIGIRVYLFFNKCAKFYIINNSIRYGWSNHQRPPSCAWPIPMASSN